MEDNSRQVFARWKTSAWIPLIILFCGIILSISGWWFVRDASQDSGSKLSERLSISLSGSEVANWVLAQGLICSVICASLVWALAKSREKAVRLAASKTDSLQRKEEENRLLTVIVGKMLRGVILTDTERRIEWANDAFTQITGFTLEEVKGKTLSEILIGQDTDLNIVEKIRERLLLGEACTEEIQGYRKGGQPFWLLLDIQPLRDEQGQITGYMALETDVTEQKRAQLELARKEAEARSLALVASRTSNAVVLADADWRITWINEGFTRIYGYTLEETKGKKPGDILPALSASSTVPSITEAISKQQPFHGETLNRAKDGRPVWVELEIQPIINAMGRLEGFMALHLDITERKAFEKELGAAKEIAEKAKETAEMANQAKSAFLATMSHEIRTPMNGVIGMTSLLLDTPLSELQRDYVETVRNSSDALLTIINDILDFSKIESGKLELESQPVCIRTVVENVTDLLSSRASEKRIELLYEITEDVPSIVLGDAIRMSQILTNLVGNALKFTVKGEVELKVRLERADEGKGTANSFPPALDQAAHDKIAALHFTVRDTGIGIAPEVQKRLFKSFSQADASTTRRFGGTGLGLAISKRLTEFMNGSMWLESSPGLGSTFHCLLRLPLAEAAEDLPPVLKPPTNLAGKRLLIVDDNASSRRILSSFAERWEMPFVTAESGEAALAMIKKGERFDLGVVDMMMPGLDGVGFAFQLQLMGVEVRFPLVLLSTPGKRPDLASEVFGAFLNKPVKPALLRRSLSELLKKPEAEARRELSLAEDSLPAVRLRQEKILLVEDNAVNQKVARHLLRRLGYRADIAANGLEALAAIEAADYCIILMDMQMPEMNGLEATQHIRRNQKPGAVRPWIIALTANAMLEDRNRCLEAGMDDFISKPINTVELKAALDHSRISPTHS